MITARLSCSENGALVDAHVEGHAFFAQKGTDIVCAAVSVLLRTTAAVLAHSATVSFACERNERGFFVLTVTQSAKNDQERLVYAADFLIEGLRSLQAEFPQCVSVQMQTK